jgi:pyrroloquinoline quinone (PQQ) biosynthesis protein C
MDETLRRELTAHPLRAQLFEHDFFEMARRSQLTMDDAGAFLGQYWHPIHYFPAFLSRVIAASPYVPIQTAVSKIVWQELGEGDPVMAHEVIYIDTMTAAGFSKDVVVNSPANAATAALMRGYVESSESDYCRGLGFMYGTEIIDLTIVKGLGEAIRRSSNWKHALPWVDIHVKQEPDHVESANHSIEHSFTERERRAIVESAALHWQLWIDFFSALRNGARTAAAARVGTGASPGAQLSA